MVGPTTTQPILTATPPTFTTTKPTFTTTNRVKLLIFTQNLTTPHIILGRTMYNYANAVFNITGCSPLQLGSISTPAINARCSSLLNDMSQLVEGIQGDNIIYCYSSEATLQGSVAVAYCSQGHERVGPERVTCNVNGSWGQLPVCRGINVMSQGI